MDFLPSEPIDPTAQLTNDSGAGFGADHVGLDVPNGAGVPDLGELPADQDSPSSAEPWSYASEKHDYSESGDPEHFEPSDDAEEPSHQMSTFKAVMLGAMVGALVAAIVAGSIVWAGRGTKSASGSNAQTAAVPLIKAGSTIDIQQILTKAEPSVVSIKTNAGAQGSGVIVSADGLILTNNHVIEGATSYKVTLFNGDVKTAEVVGSEPANDVAVIRIKDGAGLTAADLGSSDALKVGDDVLAIGNALALAGSPTVTRGIVSAKERIVDEPNNNVHLEHMLQTDAAINPGNSGGPLINTAGQVVGINTAVNLDGQNIGFAISIDSVKSIIDDIKAGKAPVKAKAFLGVSTEAVSQLSPTIKSNYGIVTTDGAFVSEVVPDSGAAVAGLQAGDTITDIDGTKIASNKDVGAVIAKHVPGDSLKITYERKGKLATADAKLGSRAATA